MADHPVTDMAAIVHDEIMRDKGVVAQALFGDGSIPGRTKMTQAEFKEYVVSGWFRGLPMAQPPQSPEQFRTGLRKRMGAEKFLKLAQDVVPEATQRMQQELAEQQAEQARMLAMSGMAPMPVVQNVPLTIPPGMAPQPQPMPQPAPPGAPMMGGMGVPG